MHGYNYTELRGTMNKTNTIKEKLKELIHSEGFEVNPYTDTKGNITGGVGHLFTKNDYKEFNPNWTIAEKEGFWMKILEQDYAIAWDSAVEDASKFAKFPSDTVLKVMAELKFNMGIYKFSKRYWPKMYAALNNEDYKEAAKELLTNRSGGPSAWALDVKENRANRIADTLREA